jgi:hypothetical protein
LGWWAARRFNESVGWPEAFRGQGEPHLRLLKSRGFLTLDQTHPVKFELSLTEFDLLR